MAKFNFDRGFFLLLNDGKRIRFEKGVQDVPDEHADHWYLHENGTRLDVPAPAIALTAVTETEEPAASMEEPQGEPEDGKASEPPANDPPPAPPADNSGPSTTEEPDGTVHYDTAEEILKKRELQTQAATLGIQVDGRWGIPRLTSEIAAKTAKAA